MIGVASWDGTGTVKIQHKTVYPRSVEFHRAGIDDGHVVLLAPLYLQRPNRGRMARGRHFNLTPIEAADEI
jgi:hypothetical protein